MARRFAAWRDLDPRIGRLAAARAVNTLGLSLVMSFLGIYVIDERGYSAKLYGALALIANLGWAMGPALGGLLSWVVPYGAVFFLAAAGMLIAAWLCRGIDVAGGGDRALAPVRLSAALREAVDHPPMLTLLVATVVFALAHTQMYTLFTVYLSDELGLSKLEIGLTYMVNGVLVLALQWWALGAISRLGVTRILPLAALVFAAGYAAVGLATGLATAMGAIAIITVAEVAFAPAHQAAAADSGDAARLGKSFGLVSWAQTVGIAFAPLVGGALFDAIGEHHVALWSCVAGGCLALAALLVRYGRQRAAATPPPSVRTT